MWGTGKMNDAVAMSSGEIRKGQSGPFLLLFYFSWIKIISWLTVSKTGANIWFILKKEVQCRKVWKWVLFWHYPSKEVLLAQFPFKLLFYFQFLQTLKFKTMAFPISKIYQTLQGDSFEYKEQLSFLAQLQNPYEFWIIKYVINSNLNFP
jgi:hypothetical protein